MHDRHGAKQPERFDPARAARLDDPERLRYLPVADVLAMLDPAPHTRVIDFGTGTGTYAIAIAKARPDLQVIAYDEQPAMLDHLRAKLAREPMHNVSPVLAGEDVTIAAERLLAINVLHEIGDEALRRMATMVTSGGCLLFIDWNADVERPVGPPRDHVYGVAEARARLQEAGFSIVAERMFPYHYALLA